MAARALILLAVSATAGALPVPERVTFPSQDVDASGAPVAITALYFRPPNPHAPLVIAAHGCGGIYSAAAGKQDRLSERSIAWTEQWLQDGYAVLWPDSFNPRGRRSVCLVKRGEPTITPITRRLDMLGALAYAPQLPGVDAARIALVGWSHGGSTTLATVNGKVAPGPPPALRAAVAFYPGCVVSLRAGEKWLPSPALRVHIGALDDWSRPDACEQLGVSARARGADMTVTVYPGAYHEFDAPRGKVRVWKEVTTGVNPGNGVTVGPDPAARAAAQDAVRTFLRSKLSEGKP
jgi:dienelactone hydrolase